MKGKELLSKILIMVMAATAIPWPDVPLKAMADVNYLNVASPSNAMVEENGEFDDILRDEDDLDSLETGEIYNEKQIMELSAEDDFEIDEDGSLVKYKGSGGDVSIPAGVTSIGSEAFKHCTELTSVTIPEGVTSIGKDAFRSCGSLTSITIPEGVTSIGYAAFAYCYSLTSITIPKSVTSIHTAAFADCRSLTSITIPEGVTIIEDYTFSDCRSLTSLTIPDSVAYIIGDHVFERCNREELVINCTPGSYAETYAKEHNIPYNTDGSGNSNAGSETQKGGLQWTDSILDSMVGQEGIKCAVGDIHKGICFAADTNKEIIKEEDSGLVWESSDNDLLHYCGSYFDKESGNYYGYFKALKPGTATISVKNSNGETITRKIKCGLTVSLKINDGDLNKNTYGYQDGKYKFEKTWIKAAISNESAGALSHLLGKNQQEKDIYEYADGVSIDKEASAYHVDSMKFLFDSNNVPLSFDKDSFLQETVWTDSNGIIEYGGELSSQIAVYPNKNYTVREDVRGINFDLTCNIEKDGKTDFTQKVPLRFINYDVPENTGGSAGSPIFSDGTKDAFKETIEKSAEQNLIRIPLGSLFTEDQSRQLNIILTEWINIVTNPETDIELKKALFESYSEEKDRIESGIIIPVEIDNVQYPKKGTRRIRFSLEFRDIGKGLNWSLKQIWENFNLSASTNLLEWELLDKNGISLGEYSGILDFITYADLASLHDLMDAAEKKAKEDFQKALDKDLGPYTSEVKKLYESILAESDSKILPYANDVMKNWFIAGIWGEEFKESNFIDSIKGTLKKQLSKKITVKCPVDVYLYYDGQPVGIVENNTINPVYHTHYIGSYVSVDNDTKYIYLPDEDFSIKLVGNDEGTMDYIVEEYEKGAEGDAVLVRTVYFDNLPLEKGKTYTGDLKDGIRKDKSEYALHTDGQRVEATYDTLIGDQITDKPSSSDTNNSSDSENKPGNGSPSNNGNSFGTNSSKGTGSSRRNRNNTYSNGNKMTMDGKRGYVDSLTGIITGEGPGYSKWQRDMTGWKLCYIDGTYAAGTTITDSLGENHEQILWEQVNGSWYAFDINSYAKEGFVYDYTLSGWFYIDINRGMLTGWQLIDGKWYYFNPISDGNKGKMFSDAWVDKYYVNLSGVWEEKH